jgi:hypothetical protein
MVLMRKISQFSITFSGCQSSDSGSKTEQIGLRVISGNGLVHHSVLKLRNYWEMEKDKGPKTVSHSPIKFKTSFFPSQKNQGCSTVLGNCPKRSIRPSSSRTGINLSYAYKEKPD